MTMRWTIGADAVDPHRLAAFWKLALGYIDEPGYDDADGASIVDPDDTLPVIGFLRVPEGKTAKNRLHLDLRTCAGEDVEPAERVLRIRDTVARLIAAGATEVRTEYYGPEEFGHVVLLDPEGNEFCVA